MVAGQLIAITPARATLPSGSVNFAGASKRVACVYPTGELALRDATGAPLGIKAHPLKYARGACAPGTVRVATLERLTGADPTTPLYYLFGAGRGAVGGRRYGESGHVTRADLATEPEILGRVGCAVPPACNGAGAPGVTLTDGSEMSYVAQPRPIPRAMMHADSSGERVWNTWETYGTPAAPYAPNHTSLSWSWLNRRGGGIVRALMARGTVFVPADVEPIRLFAYSGRHGDRIGAINGEVIAIYGRFWNGGGSIYGWTVFAHRYQDSGWTVHFAGNNPPGAPSATRPIGDGRGARCLARRAALRRHRAQLRVLTLRAKTARRRGRGRAHRRYRRLADHQRAMLRADRRYVRTFCVPSTPASAASHGRAE